jgi:hypothetical protein
MTVLYTILQVSVFNSSIVYLHINSFIPSPHNTSAYNQSLAYYLRTDEKASRAVNANCQILLRVLTLTCCIPVTDLIYPGWGGGDKNIHRQKTLEALKLAQHVSQRSNVAHTDSYRHLMLQPHYKFFFFNCGPRAQIEPALSRFPYHTHLDTHAVRFLSTGDQFVAKAATYTTENKHNDTKLHVIAGIRTRAHSNRAAAELCLIWPLVSARYESLIKLFADPSGRAV